MAKPTKFTFKNHPKPTGLMRIGHKDGFDIRLAGSRVGWGRELDWESWAVNLHVKQEAHPGWKNITLTARFKSAAELKEWVNTHFNAIIEKFELHTLD